MDPKLSYTVIEYVFGIHDTLSALTVMCNGTRFRITMKAESFDDSPSIKQKYLHFLEVAEAYELDGLTVDDFYDWVLEPFHSIFSMVTLPAQTTPISLHHHLFARTIHYTLRAVNAKLTPLRISEADFGRLPAGVCLPSSLLKLWPCFAPNNVQICAANPQDALSDTPQKVLTDGKLCYFKQYHAGDTQNATREISNYRRIEDASLARQARISRLHGLVYDAGTDIVFGLLLLYIDCSAKTLAWAAGPDTTGELRQRWAKQVMEAVKQLHNAGLVWGDVKPDNVLIDANNDAWLIDFGGGYTEGWVEKDLADTIEGDLQGLSKILEYLCVGGMNLWRWEQWGMVRQSVLPLRELDAWSLLAYFYDHTIVALITACYSV